MLKDNLSIEELYSMGYNYITDIHADNMVFANEQSIVTLHQNVLGTYKVRSYERKKNAIEQQCRIPFPEAIKKYYNNSFREWRLDSMTVDEFVEEEVTEYVDNKTPFNYILTLSTIYQPEDVKRSDYFWMLTNESLEIYNKYRKNSGFSDYECQKNTLIDLTKMIEDEYLWKDFGFFVARTAEHGGLKKSE